MFSREERVKVKAENPFMSFGEIAKELGRRWAVLQPNLKQRYQHEAEQKKQKNDQEMAAYRKAHPVTPLATSNANPNPARSSLGQAGASYVALSGNDLNSFLLQ